MNVLVLNSGSSSQKSALFTLPDGKHALAGPVWEATIEWRKGPASLVTRNSAGATDRVELGSSDREGALNSLFDALTHGPTKVLAAESEIDAVGHRIVHGGPKLVGPAQITAEVKKTIAEVAAIAPLHNSAGLQGIELAERRFKNTPQFAVFDTGFHHTLPLFAAVYPGPYQWYELGIRRFGFHGINHQYCAEKAAEMVARAVSSLKIVTCHLGNGCSLAAINGGRSVDTTMGFTPLEGLMMGTRSGSVDPGVLTYLLRTTQTTGQGLDDMLNKQSGLAGISGLSGDMREVIKAAQSGNLRAQLAFEMFIHRLCKAIAAMMASLGGMDILVFTAGIGENSAEVREAACRKLAFLGLELDTGANAARPVDKEISAPGSAVRVLVIQAREGPVIARECARMLTLSGTRP